MNKVFGRAGFLRFGAKQSAETYFYNFPDGYNLRMGQLEGGSWFVSYRWAVQKMDRTTEGK